MVHYYTSALVIITHRVYNGPLIYLSLTLGLWSCQWTDGHIMPLADIQDVVAHYIVMTNTASPGVDVRE